jgi:dinuclear metal center YbgI/SA1388 family protein
MQPFMSDLFHWVDSRAPFDTQADFDNSGFLVGRKDAPVQNILFALDVSDRVLDEAEAHGANLIITHHPMMFSPVQSITEDDVEGRLISRMIRNHVSLISAHTNLDSAPGGINDTLASVLGLQDVQGEGYLRKGRFSEPVRFSSLVTRIEHDLHTTVRVFGQAPADMEITAMAVSSGAGSDFWSEAHHLGAQVFLTGEIKHHHGLAMCACGMIGLEAGHFATEEPGLFALADALQNHANEVEWNVTIFKSAVGAYALPTVPVAGS